MKGCVLHRAGPCEWPVDPHHVVTKQRIKRHATGDITAALRDERNLIPLCRRHHHRITHGWDRPALAVVLRSRLGELEAFADEYGLRARLERELSLYGVDVSQKVDG